MNRIYFTILLLSSISLYSQTDKKEFNDSSEIAFNQIVIAVSDHSYMQFPLLGSNKLNGMVRKEERLVSEFKISSVSLIRFDEHSNWGGQLNFTILGRMFNLKSTPVYSPTFNPNIKFYRYWSPTRNYLQVSSIGLAHYSNGQNGKYHSIDGSINVINGNFSTDYIEINHFWSTNKGIDSKSFWIWGLNYQQHLPWFTRATYMDRDFYYGKLTSKNSFYSNTTIPYFLDLKCSLNWGVLGYKPNLEFSPSFGFKPKKMVDLYLFANYFNGRDYYNNRHVYKRSAVMVGLLFDPVNLNIFR